MMKRRIATILLLLSMFPILALAEQERYTISEIRDQANELLEAYGSVGTVKVETAKGVYDIPIDIPEVDRVPVLKVTFPSTDQVPSAPENGELSIKMCDYNSTSYLANWSVKVNSDKIYGEYVKNTTRVGSYDMDTRADGSPLTMEESIAFAEQILSYYKEQFGWEFTPHNFTAYSRQYKATAGRNGFIPDMSQPVDDTGYYSLEFDQMFYGISYYRWYHIRFTYPSKNDRQAPTPSGLCDFTIFSTDSYSYGIMPCVETAVLAEDVPLCALETVIEAFKKSCKVQPTLPTSLRFVYLSMNDPDDRNGDLILTPFWILESDAGPGSGKGWIAAVNAQTGKWINTEQKETDGGRRSDAIWFGWEDIYED